MSEQMLEKLMTAFGSAPGLEGVITAVMAQCQDVSYDAVYANLIDMGFEPVEDIDSEDAQLNEDVNRAQAFLPDMTRSVISNAIQEEGNLQSALHRLIDMTAQDDEEEVEAEEEEISEQERLVIAQRLLAQQAQREHTRKQQQREAIRGENEELRRLREQKLAMEKEVEERERQRVDYEAEVRRREEENAAEMRALQEQAEAAKADKEQAEALRDQLEQERARNEAEKRERESEAERYANELEALRKNQAEQNDEIEERIHETMVRIQEVLDDGLQVNAEQEKCKIGFEKHGSKILLTWKVEDENDAASGSWIGLFNTQEDNSHYMQSKYTKGDKDGVLRFAVPKTAGLYHFRYFVNKADTEPIASSNFFNIGAQIKMEVNLEGTSIMVHWESCNNTPPAKGDWVGLFKKSHPFKSVYCVKKAKIDISTACVVIDGRVPAGEYQVRYFPCNSGYFPTVLSTPIDIPDRNKLEVTSTSDDSGRMVSQKVYYEVFSHTLSTSDYIALYNKTKSNGSYITYKYINVNEPCVEFDAPIHIGEYDYRFHSGSESKRTCVVKSSTFSINNTDEINAVVEGGCVIVATWDIHSQVSSSYDWVGLFHASETNNKKYLKSVYVSGKDSVTFNPIASGTYEVRFFSSKLGKYTSFRSSEPVTVQI